MPILNMTYKWGSTPLQPFHLNWVSNLLASTLGNNAVITWTDPWNLVVDGRTLATWDSTKLVRKLGSAPTDSSDWNLVLTETVANTYSSTGYTDSGLTGGNIYYYAVFVVSTDWLETISNISSAAITTWVPDSNRTIFYYEFERNLNDLSWNNHNITGSSSIDYETIGWQDVLVGTGSYPYLSINPSWTSSIQTGNFTASFWIYPVSVPSYMSNGVQILGIFYNYSPFNWPTIFYDPNDVYWHGDSIIFRMRWGGSSYEHTWITLASSLYNSWHHIVMTRNNGTVSCYIDWALEVDWQNDSISFPTYDYQWYIFSRSGEQYWGNSWAKCDKYIFENVGWSSNDVSTYYNETKGIYGIS